MEQQQKSDMEQHISILFEDLSSVNYLEYTWVHQHDIEKRIPVSVTLKESDADGLFRIQVKSTVRTHIYLLLRTVYKSGEYSYGLLTAKHFSDTYTDVKGHKVKKMCVLACAPLAWVKLISNSASGMKTLTYTGDTVHGYQPEMIISKIYSDLKHYIDTTFVVTRDTEDSARTQEIIMLTTLSALGAPLAFKVLHEQSRLTLERIRMQGYNKSLAVPDSECAVWGTCVMWQQAGQDLQSLSRKILNQDTELSPVPAARWLSIRLIYEGLEVTRSSQGVSSIKHVISAPYWAVVLSALCCGALQSWSQDLQQLALALRVDAEHLCSGNLQENTLCQRCGFSYRISPLLCENEPKRVAAVLQIDKVLVGRICTTLCASVSKNVVCEVGAQTKSDSIIRYCLNHRRRYRASPEENWEREKSSKGEHKVNGYGEERLKTHVREFKKAQLGLEEDPGWWIWQKDCRDMRRFWDKETKHKNRFWQVHGLSSRYCREELDRVSTSFGLWEGCSCHAVGYHIKTFPFGTGYGILNS